MKLIQASIMDVDDKVRDIYINLDLVKTMIVTADHGHYLKVQVDTLDVEIDSNLWTKIMRSHLTGE